MVKLSYCHVTCDAELILNLVQSHVIHTFKIGNAYTKKELPSLIPITDSIFAFHSDEYDSKIISTLFPMPFKKLHVDIQEKLTELEITTPTLFQKNSIPVIKSGANVYCFAPDNSGKTTTLILTTLQKLKCEAVGSSPRAVVLVENKEKALALYDAFLTYTKHTSLRVYVGYEQLHIDVQKSEIFEGIDILISTPVSMNKLFLTNGLSVSQLKIFNIDDADFLVQKSAYSALMSITSSVEKCQYVLYSDKMHPVLERFESYFMEYSKIISV